MQIAHCGVRSEVLLRHLPSASLVLVAAAVSCGHQDVVRSRIAAGTLAPDGMRWTAASLEAKRAREAARDANLLASGGDLWDVEPSLPIGTILRLEAERRRLRDCFSMPNPTVGDGSRRLWP